MLTHDLIEPDISDVQYPCPSEREGLTRGYTILLNLVEKEEPGYKLPLKHGEPPEAQMPLPKHTYEVLKTGPHLPCTHRSGYYYNEKTRTLYMILCDFKLFFKSTFALELAKVAPILQERGWHPLYFATTGKMFTAKANAFKEWQRQTMLCLGLPEEVHDNIEDMLGETRASYPYTSKIGGNDHKAGDARRRPVSPVNRISLALTNTPTPRTWDPDIVRTYSWRTRHPNIVAQ